VGKGPQIDNTPANRPGWFIATRKAIVPPEPNPATKIRLSATWNFSPAAAIPSNTRESASSI
jgi:hypothetical protein